MIYFILNYINIYIDIDKSISYEKDYLLWRIEEKWNELKNSPMKSELISDELNELKQSKIFLSNINDSSFSLTKILESHKVFQSCRTKVVPRTEYLNTFNVKLKDFDYRNLITYSLINNKIYQAFLAILKDFEPDYKRSLEFQGNPIKKDGITLEYMLNFVAYEKLHRSVKLTIEFLKQIPGFAELPGEQFSKIVKRGVMDFHIVTAAPMIRDGESYIVFNNGIHLSRKWLNKMRGKEKTDIKIDAAESINKLGINEREKALLLVYLFSLPGIIYI